MVDQINKLPPEARPPAQEAAKAEITALAAAAIRMVKALPGDQPDLDPVRVKLEAILLELKVDKLPPSAPAADFDPVVDLIRKIDDSVNLLTSGPSFPHYQTAALIQEQAQLMLEYINTHVIG